MSSPSALYDLLNWIDGGAAILIGTFALGWLCGGLTCWFIGGK